jgi:hypothetical protein
MIEKKIFLYNSIVKILFKNIYIIYKFIKKLFIII